VNRRIVVDSDVAQAAGLTERPRSSRSRVFLQTMRDVEDHVVVTPEIRAEWERHWSRFFRTWLRSMHGRKQVAQVKAPRDETMRDRLGELGLGAVSF
jgi:hypothetical protein